MSSLSTKSMRCVFYFSLALKCNKITDHCRDDQRPPLCWIMLLQCIVWAQRLHIPRHTCCHICHLAFLNSNIIPVLLQVMPRNTTALADVSAGFRLRVDEAAAHTVTDSPVIVYGGISPSFVGSQRSILFFASTVAISFYQQLWWT